MQAKPNSFYFTSYFIFSCQMPRVLLLSLSCTVYVTIAFHLFWSALGVWLAVQILTSWGTETKYLHSRFGPVLELVNAPSHIKLQKGYWRPCQSLQNNPLPPALSDLNFPVCKGFWIHFLDTATCWDLMLCMLTLIWLSAVLFPYLVLCSLYTWLMLAELTSMVTEILLIDEVQHRF